MSHHNSYRNWIGLFVIIALGLGLAIAITSLARAGNLTYAVENVQVPTAPPRIYRVEKTGDGSNGSSWAKAYKTVQDALSAANSGDQIWVASGVYTPGINQSDSFILKAGVSLYGGFKPGDTELSDRDWKTNVTVLSGDIGGDDDSDTDGVVQDTSDINGGNAFHVLDANSVNESTILDGFTITAGQANGSDLNNKGGGLYCNFTGSGKKCSLTLSNITFAGNLAGYGGGMYNYINGGSSSPLLTNVNFSSNEAITSGGGMYNAGFYGTNNPGLYEVNFLDNTATEEGGAMYNIGAYGTCNPSLEDVYFIGNIANMGGAMYNDGTIGASSPILTRVAFIGNQAADGGGAMVSMGNTNPILTNVLFSGNYALSGGALAISCAYSSNKPLLTNVTFSGNSAFLDGGAIYNFGCHEETEIRNSILWNNMDISGTGTISATIYLDSGAAISLTNSLVQGTFPGGGWIGGSYGNGGGNLDQDPKFVSDINPLTAPTTAGDLHLKENSPAIDAGDNDYISGFTTDLDGEARLRDGDKNGSDIVDMGAYEFLPKHQFLVTKSGSGDGLVSSSPVGIDCGSVCSILFQEDTLVTLTAAPDTNSIFTGWSGDCSGALDCQLTMDAAKSVDAKFEIALKVQLPLVVR